ncbi:MAG: chromosomal replication initiator protein DnaA [Oscillospiraceae bacterium]|jgi:chromosomal replication initiator protein
MKCKITITETDKGEVYTMNSSSDVWKKIMQILEPQLTSTTITTWFDDTVPVDVTDTALLLYSPSEYKREIITRRYVPLLKEALHELFSAEFEVRVLDDLEMEQRGEATEAGAPMVVKEEYTFESFIVGSSNKFAHAAARSVADHPAQSYNPLFIYGESGLGKTHLLHAIAHTVRRNHPDYKIVYVKGDDFTNELVRSIREGKNMEFRDKYRQANLFLVDDIQFIAGKVQTQEEFFHTFNCLYEEKRQIVLTSDRPPKEMTRLEDRLKTRFEWGLLADIQPPDYETRLAIIKTKAIRLGMNLPDAVLEYIAENVTANVRQIEGTVNKILAFRDLMDDSINVNTVSRAVRDMFKDQSDLLPSPALIIDEASKFYNLEADDVRGQQRNRTTVLARQIAMYLIRRMTNLSLSDIGKEFNGRDHTTAMHSISRIEEMLKTNSQISEVVKDITANINAHNY